MKLLILLAIAACVSTHPLVDTKLDEEWKEYMLLYNKVYESEAIENNRYK